MKKFVGKFNYTIITLVAVYALTLPLIQPLPIFAERGTDKVVLNAETTQENAAMTKANAAHSYADFPVYFEQNDGQFNERVKFLARGTKDYSLFLTDTQAVYLLQEKTKNVESETNYLSNPKSKAVAVYMTLVEANENVVSNGVDKSEHQTNYLKGEKSNRRTEIPNFAQVKMKNVYKGIDAIWKGKSGGAVQYDFSVAPFADPHTIKWRVEGAEKIEIDQSGDLLIETELGTIRQEKPYSYQETANATKTEVESRFIINKEKDEISFRIGEYDQTKQLTIDPTVNLKNIAYSTFLGGGGSSPSTTDDGGNAVAVDSAGNVFVTGFTDSSTFPTTAGAFDTASNGGRDVFVTKLNSTGSALIYSTYIGGNNTETSRSISVDSAGNAYIIGDTSSTDFPTTAGAYDRTFNGSSDVFITKLNAAGSALVYSTYLGGNGSDYGYDLAIDSVGNSYVTGQTFSNSPTNNFPTTAGAYDTTFNSPSDAFVTKLNAAGSALVFSTYLGGSGGETGRGIAVDSEGNAYITGDTSGNFPTTQSAYDLTYNGGDTDAFITKLHSSGSFLAFSTYLGAFSNDTGRAIGVDAAGNVTITGETVGGIDFPTTPGAFDTTFNVNNPNFITDGFATKFNSIGSALVYSTFIGGNGDDFCNDMYVDSAGNAYIAGQTNSFELGNFINVLYGSGGGLADAFVIKLNITGTQNLFSTRFGGNSTDIGRGIAVSPAGYIFLTGETFSESYPTTAGSFNRNINGSGVYSGNSDAFIAKLGVNSASSAINFDNDGRSDIAVFRPSNGAWYMNRSTAGFTGVVFGQNGDLIAPADYDADGKTDVAVFRPSNGAWYYLSSINNTFNGVSFGQNGDLPRPGDFDGDGRADISVFRPSNGAWYRLNSSDGSFYGIVFGQNGDKPLIADFDGDGKSDVSVFRPSNGGWYRINSSDGSFYGTIFGQTGDVPTVGDYDGDGKTDVSVFRPSNGGWYRLNSSNNSFYGTIFGQAGDIPTVGDYDGDGKSDISLFRPLTGGWYRLNSANGAFYGEVFGASTDKPISSAFN